MVVMLAHRCDSHHIQASKPRTTSAPQPSKLLPGRSNVVVLPRCKAGLATAAAEVDLDRELAATRRVKFRFTERRSAANRRGFRFHHSSLPRSASRDSGSHSLTGASVANSLCPTAHQASTPAGCLGLLSFGYRNSGAWGATSMLC
jgi:hypothetical protein